MNGMRQGMPFASTTRKSLIISERRRLASEAETVRELVSILGGPNLVAEQLGITHPAVCEWSRLNSIPISKIATLVKVFRLPSKPLRKFIRLAER